MPSYDAAFYIPLVGSLLAPGSTLPPGGAETQLYLLARELARLGGRVCLISYPVAGVPERVEGIDVVVRPPARWRQIAGPAGKLAEVATVLRVIAGLDARTFVQRGTSMESGLVGLAAKARRRRFVYSSANEVDFDWGSVASRGNVALFNLGLRLADSIVVQTVVQERLCHARIGRRPVLIRSLIEPSAPARETPEAFLWIGKLASYKRPLEFVELARAVPEAPFWMVGVPSEKDSAPLATRLEQAARELPNFALLDARPRNSLMELVARSIAIVSTSQYEGMANVILEGWARGVPALTLSHDPDALIESERLGACAGGSRERLAALALQLWHTREDRQELSERCRAYVERAHGPRAVAERWLEVLAVSASRSSLPAR